MCAGEQDAFWPMHDRLFASRAEWSRDRRPWERFGSYAAELGLDTARFTSCVGKPAARELIERHNQAARRFRVRATPTFFVNGRRVEGALPTAAAAAVARSVERGGETRSFMRREPLVAYHVSLLAYNHSRDGAS